MKIFEFQLVPRPRARDFIQVLFRIISEIWNLKSLDLEKLRLRFWCLNDCPFRPTELSFVRTLRRKGSHSEKRLEPKTEPWTLFIRREFTLNIYHEFSIHNCRKLAFRDVILKIFSKNLSGLRWSNVAEKLMANNILAISDWIYLWNFLRIFTTKRNNWFGVRLFHFVLYLTLQLCTKFMLNIEEVFFSDTNYFHQQ